MGYGKTTAVKNFLKNSSTPAIWFTFSEIRQTREVFWSKLTDEIVAIAPESGAVLKSLGYPSSAPQMEKFLQVLIDLSCIYPFLLVLDDYQNAKDSNLSTLLMQLAGEEIDGFHMLIITRSTMDLDFVELLSRGLCSIITQNQLRFTKDELMDYCRLCNITITQEDVHKIYEYSDGWIAFAYIILLGLENGVPIGMSLTAESLIEKALFSTYSKDIQAFLFKLSLMEDFTAEKAEYVTGESSARHILRKLNIENPFISYDETSETYRIHHVLLDFLRTKQSFSIEEKFNVYSHLSDWYMKQKLYQIAYGYLYQIGQYEKILAHLNLPRNIQNVPFTFTGAHEMFHQTSRELLLQYPIAYLVYIFYTMMTGEENEILSWEKRIDELEQYYRNLEGIEETYRNRILGEALIVRKFTLFNHIEEMKASNWEIVRLLNGQNSYITTQENEFTFGSPHYLYLYYRNIGSFQSIKEILTETVGYAEFSNGCGSGCDSLAAAEYALETGDFGQVDQYLDEAFAKAKVTLQTAVLLCIDFCRIRLRIVQGKMTEALELLSQMQANYEVQNNSLYNTTLDLCKGYIFASTGRPEQVPAWLQIGDISEAVFMNQGIAYNYLVYGKALLASGKYIELEALTPQFKKYFSLYHNQLGLLHHGIFAAVVTYHLKRKSEGVQYLKAALEAGEPDQLLMPFVECSPHIHDMLQSILLERPDSEYLKRIISLGQSYQQTILEEQPIRIVMTPRELSILFLSAEGLKRKDIADRLYVTEETVKSHFKNIYQKLEVNSKLSAIKIARDRGYFESLPIF